MNAHVDELIDEALAPDERSAVVTALLESLDGEDEAIVAKAWADEIDKRRADLRSGVARAVPWSEARAQLTRCDGISVVIALTAESDIRDAFGWYSVRNVRAAHNFRAEVFSAIERIALGPLIRAADETGTRKRILQRFPYTVMYEVNQRTVTILAVAHQRRQPGYWRKTKI